MVSPPTSSTHHVLRPDKALLTGWLLLLLDEGATYGYKLQRELEVQRVNIDPGTVYRRLRQLEHDGWIESRWLTSVHGPRRRSYRLKPKGTRRLDEIAGLIAAVHDTHNAFVLAYEQVRQPRPETDDASGPLAPPTASSIPGALRPVKALLMGWLLLLLDGTATHGYDLGHRLAERRLRVDPSLLYRTLRALDHDGYVASRWGSAVSGPRRRIYRLTPEGRHTLDDLARQIITIRDSNHAFIQAYERAHGQPPPAGGETSTRP